MSERFKNFCFYIFISFLLMIGVYLRVLFYSYGRPFWNDESALALNLINHTFIGLFGNLNDGQVSPPLFICFTKLFGFFINRYEYAYRLPALLCSIVSIPVFFILCKRLLIKKVSIIFALLLFVLNYQLIYYGQELKQYSADVLIFLLVLLCYFYIDLSKENKPLFFITGIAFFLSIWFSYTSIFGIFSLAILLLIKYYRYWKNFLLLFSPFLISCILFLIFKQNLNTNEYLHMFWAEGFLNWNFSNINQILVDNIKYYFPGYINRFLIYIMLITGLVFCIRKIKKVECQIIIIPIILALILSYFHIYPLYYRVSLYLAPVLFLMMSKFFDYFDLRVRFINFIIFLFVFLHFILNSFLIIKNDIINKHYYAELTPQLLLIVEKNIKNDEVLCISSMSEINYRMYKDTVSIKNVLIESIPAYDLGSYLGSFNKLQNGKTYYILMTHSGDKILEYNNLMEIMKTQKNVSVTYDANYNTLIKFTKI